jgi:hypothetical protein
MTKRLFKSLLPSVISVALFLSCGGDEKEAKDMLIQSQRFLKAGKLVQLGKHLDNIISQYPDTKAAETAKAMRNEMTQRANYMAETMLKAAFAAATGCAASYPDSPVTMRNLRDFGFKGMAGVKVEIVRDDPADFQITSAHVSGDRVYSVGTDGRIQYEAR